MEAQDNNSSSNKKTRAEVSTLDDALDKEEEALKLASIPYVWCANALIENLQRGNIVFVQRKFVLPEKQSDEKPKTGKSLDEVVASPEMREQVRQSLEEREKRREQEAPSLNLASVSMAEYARSLPPYALQKDTELEIHLGAITYPSLRGLTESALHENSDLFGKFIAGDKKSQSSLLRGTFFPTFVETPILYALCQRANPEVTNWKVPLVISSYRLYRYYRAVTTYMWLELQKQQPIIDMHKKQGTALTNELQAIERSIQYFVQSSQQVQLIGEEICQKRNQKIREIARMIRFEKLHSYLNAREMHDHIEQHKDLLCTWENEMRHMTVELLNVHEALIAQILGVPGDIAESLYTPERVPPVAAIDPQLKVPMAKLGFEVMKLRLQDMMQPSQTPIRLIQEARQHSYQFLSLVTKNTESMFHAEQEQLSIDGIVPHAYYWTMLQLLMHECQVKDALDKRNVLNEKKQEK